ncbi:RNB-domain-containing protein [Neocallimastix californiae]|jgi:DIS3-like exonuclease 1|uniref:DIS3-like exonuclease 1 n=1 Tax=Neocallimastix californiae TaxID=1754190 RepID=A0A1Y2BRK1_9FUNG|nr:RNB-domain-containing protein [Neocallimastix californiae]|eukprot:ORY36765.1 RNB-domain-containing protein [Neocallimastix californiae]
MLFTNKIDRNLIIKNKKNVFKHVVRELYLRNDIPCLSECCPLSQKCHEKVNNISFTSLLQNDCTYLIPDINTIELYLELFEHENLNNIIISQTVFENIKQDKQRIVRKLLKTPLKHCIYFNNEMFIETYLERMKNETREHRNMREIINVGKWYSNHLNGKIPIIILSEENLDEFDIDDKNIIVMNMEKYISHFWENDEIYTLFQSLKEAIMDSKLHENELITKGMCPSTKFTEHLDVSVLEAGVKSGRYYKGTLYVSSNNTENAYLQGCNILDPEHQMEITNGDNDILIVGQVNRNRAIDGDVVAVELLPVSEWEVKHKKKNNINKIQNQNMNIDEERRPTGKVVGIFARNWRTYVSTIQVPESGYFNGSHFLTCPLELKIPKIRIKYSNAERIKDVRISVRIDNWPIDSKYPNGHYVSIVGPLNDVNTEITSILVEHGLNFNPKFNDSILKNLPIDTPENPWKPDENEIKMRRDLRNKVICSIDPPGCQDIDDTLSFERLDDGTFELGVHIADPSFFIPEDSPLDVEARERATTVYLADRRFDMLPKVLSERVCSIRENEDRYTVSAIFKMDENANILDTWFGRTVIRSTAELAYEQAQKIIDGEKNIPGISEELRQKLRPSLVNLTKFSRIIRERRIAKGGLELESLEVKFKFSEGKITDILQKQVLEVHKVVEECMILANAAVGEQLYKSFPNSALLRKHPFPVKSHFSKLIKSAQMMGYEINIDSNYQLAQSLNEVEKKDKVEGTILKLLATRAMSEATYVSTGVDKDLSHYGLALEYYTHFTSPIRRYADMIVHRQLLNSLIKDDKNENNENNDNKEQKNHNKKLYTTTTIDNQKLINICENINIKNRESKYAQFDSTELFQALYIEQESKIRPVKNIAIITEILPNGNGFMGLCLRFGLKAPLYLKGTNNEMKIPQSIITKKPEDARNYLSGGDIDFDNEKIIVNHPQLKKPVEFSLFDKVEVLLETDESRNHRNSVVMTLIQKVNTNIIAPQIRIEPQELLKKNSENNQDDQDSSSYITDKPIEINKENKIYKSKENTIYQILEKFNELTINSYSNIKI